MNQRHQVSLESESLKKNSVSPIESSVYNSSINNSSHSDKKDQKEERKAIRSNGENKSKAQLVDSLCSSGGSIVESVSDSLSQHSVQNCEESK